MKAYKGELNRTMEFEEEQSYKIGGVYNLGIHWATPDASSQDFLEGKSTLTIFIARTLLAWLLIMIT